MIVIDSSLWIAIYRDLSGKIGNQVATRLGGEAVAMLHPISMEVLQGTRDETEWSKLAREINKLPFLNLPSDAWEEAARLFFDLRRGGSTIRSSIDCLIAVSCLREDCTLLHNDRDFEAIAAVRPLKHIRLDVTKASPNP